MQIAIVDFRQRTREILAALERNESVTVLHQGRVRGVLHPAGKTQPPRLTEHPFFGMYASAPRSVKEKMKCLRRPRHGL